MKKRLLLITLLFGVTTFTFAQKHKDFILTLSKDTIFGNIKLSEENPHITFTHNRKRIYFHPKTLQAFGIYKKNEGYKFYKSIKNAKGKCLFVEILNEGVVNLYKYKKKEINKKYVKELYFIGKSDEKLVTITPQTYERTMQVLVKDHPDLLTKVADISYNEVPQIVASYNQQK